MQIVKGKSMAQGIAIGRIRYYEKPEVVLNTNQAQNAEWELKRYEKAKEQAINEIQALYEKARRQLGKENAEIFEAHRMLLEDDMYNDSIRQLIVNEKLYAENAVTKTGDTISKMFMDMEDEYLKARSLDIKDISQRLVNILCRVQKIDNCSQPVILVAKDLTPSDTVQMDKEHLLALVVQYGTCNSHTAILAGTMGIPALTDVIPDASWDGKWAVADGDAGILYVEPDEQTMNEMQKKYDDNSQKNSFLESLKKEKNITKSGRKIELCANIGSVSEVAQVQECSASGIGLFRSEFLYLSKKDFPTEEEQFEIYKDVVMRMEGKKVIIRTMDIGADKKVDYLHQEEEDNPALGYRGIRICLTQKDIFKTQLRALLRASFYGNLSIMFPMIISVKEVRTIKKIIEEVKEELQKEEITYGNPQLGIMIETPAAALISDQLAKEVDFFSIGTNDLTQYVLALDRQNPKLDCFYDSHHPAVLKLIEDTVKNGHACHCWVGICGELAADTTLTADFIKMGVDELSVSPSKLLNVRNAIRQTE